MFLSNPAMPEQTPGASFLLKKHEKRIPQRQACILSSAVPTGQKVPKSCNCDWPSPDLKAIWKVYRPPLIDVGAEAPLTFGRLRQAQKNVMVENTLFSLLWPHGWPREPIKQLLWPRVTWLTLKQRRAVWTVCLFYFLLFLSSETVLPSIASLTNILGSIYFKAWVFGLAF